MDTGHLAGHRVNKSLRHPITPKPRRKEAVEPLFSPDRHAGVSTQVLVSVDELALLAEFFGGYWHATVVAVAAEEGIPYMEPSYWPIPVRPALGAALLESGDPVRAEAVFRADIKRWPRNGWGLFELEKALRA